VATLNNGGGFYRKELYIHEARMKKATIVLPCINNSGAQCTIQQKSIYLGLGMISELEQQSIAAIIEEREANGPFKDLHDFIKRVTLSIEQMRLLIRSGTFNFTQRNKKELLWEVHAILQPLQHRKHSNELFDTAPKSFKIPTLVDSKIDEAFEQIELLGFSIDMTPFELLRDNVPPTVLAKDLKDHVGKEVLVLGYLVNIKQTLAGKKQDRMHFGTFIDTEGHWIDTVHFPDSSREYPFTGNGCYLMRGKVTEEYDFMTLEVSKMKRIPVIDREQAIEKAPA
jgi:DNA polymerase-3 subunit alpha